MISAGSGSPLFVVKEGRFWSAVRFVLSESRMRIAAVRGEGFDLGCVLRSKVKRGVM